MLALTQLQDLSLAWFVYIRNDDRQYILVIAACTNQLFREVSRLHFSDWLAEAFDG